MKTLCKSPRHLSEKQLSGTVLKAVAVLLAFAASIVSAIEKRYAFLVCGDPQYHAEKTANPKSLDPYSEEGMDRFIRLAGGFGGREIPKSLGGGKVSQKFLGMIVTGDLIDSADKNGGNYPAMQKFEWRRFKMDFGLTGKDGRLPYPVYELHGNHDGPQGDTFIIEDIIARNKNRPNVGMVSANGLHYSWDWGPLHLVNLGMFAGREKNDAKAIITRRGPASSFSKKTYPPELVHRGDPSSFLFTCIPLVLITTGLKRIWAPSGS